MKKKFFAVALATTMALSTAISASAETLTGTAWWTGNQIGQDYNLSGDGSVTLDINYQEAPAEGDGAFSVEVYNTGWFFTTGSDQNAWYAEGALNNNETITGAAAEADRKSTIVAGSTYKVTVTRAGSTITVTYSNPDGSKYAEYVGTNTSTPNDLKIHVMAQVGKYEVTEGKAGGNAGSEQTSTTPASGNEQKSTTAATNNNATAATTKPGKTTPKTGDVAPVAALAAVAVVACAAVVVSKKKVTE